jgi:hypothetical protein
VEQRASRKIPRPARTAGQSLSSSQDKFFLAFQPWVSDLLRQLSILLQACFARVRQRFVGAQLYRHISFYATMSCELSAVDLEADFDELMAVMWAAHEEPVQPFFRLFCPLVKGDRQASLEASTARMLEWDRQDAKARWLKVEDTSTGRIVGAAWYKIYTDNPFVHPEEEIVDWYPDDSSRDYVGQAIGQMDRPREEKAARPQVCSCAPDSWHANALLIGVQF